MIDVVSDISGVEVFADVDRNVLVVVMAAL